MLVEVSASGPAVYLQRVPELEGYWCLLGLISEGSTFQKGLGFSVLFCGGSICPEHVIGVALNNTSRNMYYQGQDLLRRAERKQKMRIVLGPPPLQCTHGFSKMIQTRLQQYADPV